MALSKIDVANMLTGATPVANGGTALTSGLLRLVLRNLGTPMEANNYRFYWCCTTNIFKFRSTRTVQDNSGHVPHYR